MFLMSTLIVLPPNPIRFIGTEWLGRRPFPPLPCWRCEGFLGGKRRRGRHLLRVVARAGNGGHGNRERPWWERLFSEEDHAGEGSGVEVSPEELLGDLGDLEEEEDDDERKFEAWRRRAEAITELWEAREDARNEESRAWEDWLGDSVGGGSGGGGYSRGGEWWSDGGDDGDSGGSVVPLPEEGLVKSIEELVLRRSDDDLLFEDRVFKYASTNSAKFLAVLVLVPWVLDFVVHDFVLMPFLDRYVEKVPLAAEFLDVRRDQKLEMVKFLKLEQARYRFEVEIGKAPPLSDDEVSLEIRHKLIELRDEWRLENRKAFANIWSDMIYGITLFLLIYFNPSQVALLKFTGYKLLNNISDTGKAFLIILITDIFLGYHSESGWHAMVEAILEHYGLEVDQAAITIFVCFVPVVIDACVKLWLFKFLPRLSPNVTNIFREMMRH